jgi:hypothetical protein
MALKSRVHAQTTFGSPSCLPLVLTCRRRLYRSLVARMPIRTAAYVIATSLINRDAGRAAAIE